MCNKLTYSIYKEGVRQNLLDTLHFLLKVGYLFMKECSATTKW